METAQVGFELTIPVFEQQTTVPTLDHIFVINFLVRKDFFCVFLTGARIAQLV